MTVVQMPDGVNVDFGARPPDEIKALILQKFPEMGQPKPADNGAFDAGVRHFAHDATFGLADELTGAIGGALDWAKGGSFGEGYDRAKATATGMDEAAAAQHPVASAVGGVAGAVATAPLMPGMTIAKVGANAGRLARAGAGLVNGATQGAVYGGLTGFGEGEGGVGNRLANAGEQAVVGGAVGGPLGAGLGAIGRKAAGVPRSAVAAAGERAGVRVPAAVSSDSRAVQQLGGVAKSIPYFGTRMVNAGEQMAADFGQAKNRIAEGFSGGAAADPAAAGKGVRDALENWIGPLTKGVTKDAYDTVDALIDSAIRTPLNETARMASQIVARNRAATLPPGAAVSLIRQAASSRDGLTYEGIKNLRTRLGEMLDSPSPLPGDMSQGELKQIYGALTKDLRAATENAGGPQARKAFDRANLLYQAVSKRREELMRVLGINPKNPTAPEAVFAAIQRKAGSSSTADIGTLNKIRKSMPPKAWDDVSSAVVEQMGRSPPTGEISLDKFFTEYNKFSPAGKAALFGHRKDLASALDDLATIASRGKAAKTFANPSGTGQTSAAIGIGLTAANPLMWPKIAVGAIGAHYLTSALSRPATVRSMTAWGRVWNKIDHVTGLGRPPEALRKSLEFVSRRLASEIGLQFGLGKQVDQIALALQGEAPATAGTPDDPSQGQ